MDSAPFAYHEVDRSGILQAANDTFCRLMGGQQETLLGRPLWELDPPEARR
jgi:PAS domain S-box-containing protein